MKNYGLQVKEIPIIFRGTVDAQEEDLTTYCDGLFEKIEDFDTGDIYYPVSTSQDMALASKLFMEIDGVIYENVPRKSYETSWGTIMYYFGSYPSDGTSDFPFFIEVNTQEHHEEVYFNTFHFTEEPAEYPAEISVKIYNRDPSSSSESKKTFTAELTGNGQINRFYARFACGENGTLHLKPYVILNGNIRVDLCNFAQGGDQYIAGDNETISFDCFVPVETHAVAYVEAENVGEYPSVIDAAMTVQYEDFVESESIVGYEGVNLRRGRR